MMHTSLWNIEQGKILSRRELAAVLADLSRKAPLCARTRMNLVIVRLACCCGLRVSEIAGLRMKHVRLEGVRPHVLIPKELAKGRRARRVPLWWDAGTLADVAAWAAERTRQGAKPDEPFICSSQANRCGTALKRHALRRRFRTACKALGAQRLFDLTIHHGRHTFISHALAGGRTLAEVRDAAGHSNVSITSAYLHVAVDEDGKLGNLFKFD